MQTLTCPECKMGFTVDPKKLPKGSMNVRCPQCGGSVKLGQSAPPESVAFPDKEKDETMLDLSDAVKALRKKNKPD
ncbi:MAG: zinc-ribbon domain-containing protein [Planctomycetes bacterium]|nr:zinc-ribbon domain-containing protein [Planctomycetota bacterium]